MVELEKVIVRTYSAGVFAGRLVEFDRATRIVILEDVRRIWYWEGAASLSELAAKGTSKPDKCLFPCVVKRITVAEVVEILDMTDVAWESIMGVKDWTFHSTN